MLVLVRRLVFFLFLYICKLALPTISNQELTQLANSLGFACGPLCWAPISELWGRRWSMLPAMLCLGLFSIGTATGKNAQTIFITRFFGGLFGSAPVSNVSAALGDIWNPKARGTAVTFYAVVSISCIHPSNIDIEGSCLGCCRWPDSRTNHRISSHGESTPWLEVDRIHRSNLDIHNPHPNFLLPTGNVCTRSPPKESPAPPQTNWQPVPLSSPRKY